MHTHTRRLGALWASAPRAVALAVVSAILAAPALPAQSATAKKAAATITEADVARRIGIIAHDSMGGRDTPSKGLDLTAQYIANEFKRVGLKPLMPDGNWLQKYTIGRRKIVAAESFMELDEFGVKIPIRFSENARFVRGSVPEKPVTAGALLLAGTLGVKDAELVPAEGRIITWLVDYQKSAENAQVLRALIARKPVAIIMATNEPNETFAQKVATQERELPFISGEASPPVIEALESAFDNPASEATGRPDLAQLRRSPVPVVSPAPPEVKITISLKAVVTQSATAPNTVGVLPGSDPKLKDEYIVFSAHMDHVGIGPESRGCRPKDGDNICNGADDDASGTIGVVELAEAFATKGLRPKRSIIFLTVSGEEKGLLGSRYFAEYPPVPMSQVVANINIDMIGRNWPDTIVAIGKEHSDLGATLNRVNAQHPELKMTAIDDLWPSERFYFRSDHYNFARKGVPVLFFFNGVHDDYHQVSDSPDKINAEKEARILKLLFYTALEIANAPARPKWKEESYKEIVEGAGRGGN